MLDIRKKYLSLKGDKKKKISRLAVVVARSSEQASCDNFHRDQSVISPVRQRWDDWKMAITRATTMAGFVECTHVELFEDVESWTEIVVVVAFLRDR